MSGDHRLLENDSREIDAVVAEINDNSVHLDCFTSTGHISVSFPISVVPPSLLRFGQPVRLSMDWDHGYRVPQFRAREPKPVAPLEGEDEIDAWIGEFLTLTFHILNVQHGSSIVVKHESNNERYFGLS